MIIHFTINGIHTPIQGILTDCTLVVQAQVSLTGEAFHLDTVLSVVALSQGEDSAIHFDDLDFDELEGAVQSLVVAKAERFTRGQFVED